MGEKLEPIYLISIASQKFSNFYSQKLIQVGNITSFVNVADAEKKDLDELKNNRKGYTGNKKSSGVED